MPYIEHSKVCNIIPSSHGRTTGLNPVSIYLCPHGRNKSIRKKYALRKCLRLCWKLRCLVLFFRYDVAACEVHSMSVHMHNGECDRETITGGQGESVSNSARG